MVRCQDVRDQAGAWIDGETRADLAAAVAAHAAACAPCAAAIAEQGAMRALVSSRAAELRGVAPADLRNAVERQFGRPGAVVVPFPAPHHASRRWTSIVSRWSLAAALALAIGGVVVAGGFGGSRLFAAQLALDHYKCLLIDGGHAGAGTDALEASWKAERGWDIDVPPTDPALDLTLVGLRRCIAGEGQMAHVLYQVGGGRLSLFIVPDVVDAAATNLSIMGVDTTSWRRGGRTYTLVGATTATSDRVVEFMRAHAH